MITATLVSGFLGAGKSTWLAGQLAHGSHHTRVVVNDVADDMPDADLIDVPHVVRLLGGCVCCDGAADLVDVLRRLCEDRHAGVEIDSVVIETSGLSDPNNVAELIRTEPVLAANLVLAEIVVVVDGLLGDRDLRHEPVAARQLDAADRVVVTKTDLCSATSATATVAALKASAPTAHLEVAPNPHGLRPADITARQSPFTGGAEADPTRPVSVTTLRLDPDVDWVVLASWVSALLHAQGDAVLRLKGSVPTARGTLVLSAVQGLMHMPRRCATTAEPCLVIVSRGLDTASLTAGWARFQAASPIHLPAPRDTEMIT